MNCALDDYFNFLIILKNKYLKPINKSITLFISIVTNIYNRKIYIIIEYVIIKLKQKNAHIKKQLHPHRHPLPMLPLLIISNLLTNNRHQILSITIRLLPIYQPLHSLLFPFYLLNLINEITQIV